MDLAAAKQRFALLREKYPALKGYLVLSLLGEQTGIGSSPKEILKDFPSLIVANSAKLLLVDFLKSEKSKDSSEAEKKRLKEQYEELVSELRYHGSGQVEIRFDQLNYELIWQPQADELVDRELTPQTRASIRIVPGDAHLVRPMTFMQSSNSQPMNHDHPIKKKLHSSSTAPVPWNP